MSETRTTQKKKKKNKKRKDNKKNAYKQHFNNTKDKQYSNKKIFQDHMPIIY